MNPTPSTHADWVQDALIRYEGALVRYAMRITGDMETARDVVQDTFLRLCDADRDQVGEYLAPWLYRVCRNRAIDARLCEGDACERLQIHELDVHNVGDSMDVTLNAYSRNLGRDFAVSANLIVCPSEVTCE